MVAAVNLTMTIRTTSIVSKNRRSDRWRERLQVARRPGVPGGDMTRGANPRVCDFQKSIIYRTMRLVTVVATLHYRRVFPKVRTAAFGMTGVAIFIDAVLLELSRVGTAMRIVAVGTDDFSFSHRHMRRTHQLRLALQMTLTADFDLGAIDPKRSYVGKLRHLFAAGFFHQRVTVNASEATAGVRTSFPEGLHATLMTTEAGFVLHLRRLTGIFTKRDHAAGTFATTGGDVIASRAMAIFAGSFFRLIAGIVEKYLAH